MTDKLLVATILCLMGSSALAQGLLEGNYNVTAFCNSVATGTQLGSIVSCEYYYVCQSTGPVQVNCTSGYAYNYTQQVCQPASQANCFYGLESPCSATTGESFAPVSGSCNKYYACNNGVSVGTGSCPAKTKFDATSRQCIWGSCSTDLVESDTPNLNSLCDVVPPNIWFGTTENCETWYKCTAGKADPNTGSCSGETSSFNVQKQICDYSNNNVCGRVTDQPLISTTTGACTSGTAPKGDATICSQYYQCQNQQWQTYNCAYGYYWDTLTSTCLTRQAATPTKGCNRCLYSTDMFVNAVDSGNCTNYYYCKNGAATPLYCDSGLFFNEDKQGCVSDTGLEEYTEDYGACHGATASGSSSTTDADSSDSSDSTASTAESSSTEESTTEATTTEKGE